MPVILRRGAANGSRPDYRAACRQTVTVYNAYEAGGGVRYHRTVIPGAYLNFQRQWRLARTGSEAGSPFLLILPQGAGGKTFVEPPDFAGAENTYTLDNGDKVLRGTGPEIATATQWKALAPGRTAGLVEIGGYELLRDLDGRACHVEAGG